MRKILLIILILSLTSCSALQKSSGGKRDVASISEGGEITYEIACNYGAHKEDVENNDLYQEFYVDGTDWIDTPDTYEAKNPTKLSFPLVLESSGDKRVVQSREKNKFWKVFKIQDGDGYIAGVYTTSEDGSVFALPSYNPYSTSGVKYQVIDMRFRPIEMKINNTKIFLSKSELYLGDARVWIKEDNSCVYSVPRSIGLLPPNAGSSGLFHGVVAKNRFKSNEYYSYACGLEKVKINNISCEYYSSFKP